MSETPPGSAVSSNSTGPIGLTVVSHMIAYPYHEGEGVGIERVKFVSRNFITIVGLLD